MAVEFVRPVSYSALLARQIALFALMMAIAAWVAVRFGPLPEPHFLAIYAAACGLALLALLGALVGFINLWRVGARGGKASVSAVFLAIPVLLPAAYGVWAYRSHPPIYEVTTDPSDPPEWLKRPRYEQAWLGPRAPAGTVERAAQADAYPALIARRYDAALDRVVEAVRTVAADRRIAILEEKVPTGMAAGEFEEPPAPLAPGAIPVPRKRPDFVPGAAPVVPELPIALFQGSVKDRITGFPYDVMIRVREDGDATLADIRVAARYGQSDLGVSASIAMAFLTALDGEMEGGSDD